MTRVRTREYLRRIVNLHAVRAATGEATPEWEAANEALAPLYAKVTRRNPALPKERLEARAEAFIR